MKDYSHGVPVSVRSIKTGEWRACCPECKAPILRGTYFGTMAALGAHMEESHFIPMKGNA